ncbi:MAG TPA: glycoside hydrolase family 5 protein [Polyangiaceae bacterium]|nr:glycoside hydrolase family 5 protein [Polyangiaceae bacterium]
MRTSLRYALGPLLLLLVACSSKNDSDDDDGGSGGQSGESGSSGTLNGGSSAQGGSGNVGQGGTGGSTGGSAAKGGGGGSSPGGTGTGGTGGGSAGTGGGTPGGTGGTGGSMSGGAGTGGSMGGTAGSTPGEIPRLHIEGTKLLDPDGNTVVLRGIDLIDLGMVYAYGGNTISAVTQRIDKVLGAGFQARVVRIPVYPRVSHNGMFPYASPYPFPSGAGGTENGPSADDYVASMLKPAVDYLTSKGLYVILDYHQIDDTDGASATEATEFWAYMAPKFAGYTNVLYEPFNEPMDTSTSWATFKPRAQQWADTIRAGAPDNIVIVPSMNWDQKPGDASQSPLTGTNLMYTMHIYPSNWNSATQAQLATAVANVPVFITEWGYMLNSTDSVGGTNDAEWLSKFRAIVDGNGASWSAWVTDDSWTPNMFSDVALTTLTDFGSKTKQWLGEAQAL